MKEIERKTWVDVYDFYFGNAVYPSGAQYRVASDGEVQRQVEIGLGFEARVQNENTQAKFTESVNVSDELLEGLHDIRTAVHTAGGAVVSLWLVGWQELGEDGPSILEKNRSAAMGGGRKISWEEFIVAGEARRI